MRPMCILGGWAVSAIVESGFPLAISQSPNNSGLFGSGQRPNVVPGVDPNTSGSTTDRLDAWLNPVPWTQAEAYTFGNAPRIDPPAGDVFTRTRRVSAHSAA